jgi:hypothetical protein
VAISPSRASRTSPLIGRSNSPALAW